MKTLDEQIEISAPAATTWEQLHRVENYPQFVGGVLDAAAAGAGRAHLDAKVAGKEHGFDAEIIDNPAERVMSWRTSQPDLRGKFMLHEVDQRTTRVLCEVEYDPEQVQASFGGPKGFAQNNLIMQTVRADLEEFKRVCEAKS